MATLKIKRPTLSTFQSWTSEAVQQHIVWQRESWRDWEFYDGLQWDSLDVDALRDKKGINALTINRVFPIINLVYGNYIRSQKDIIAKGRTKHDNELAQVVSEAIAMVADQNSGPAIQREAFQNAIIPGFGCIYTGFNNDPRKENISLKKLPWYSVMWDPYASPWFDTNECRYVLTSSWKDIDDLKMLFPKKAQEIDDACAEMWGSEDTHATFFSANEEDIGTEIENYRNYLSCGTWVNKERKRVRPVEMWYTVIEPTWFAIMPDGRAYEMDKFPLDVQYNMTLAAKELVQASVKQMYTATFIGNLLLQDIPSPFPHSEYPFTPFIGYLNRFNQPFGIPRQIREQNMEVNKRRSMALALLNSRRTTIEEDAVEDLNVAHDEVNRLDGFVVMKRGKSGAIQVDELANLAAPQIEMMRQSEQEMKEIVGANDEALGYNTPAQSGVSLEKKREFSGTVTLSLMENMYRSQKILGEKILSLIQNTWTEEKVLRVIDRLSGVEKFVEINKQIQNEMGQIEVKNDITQARFDLVITTKEISDTMREKNLDLLFSAINKAPPEAVAPLLNVAFELSDIPEKERILGKIRLATGQVDETEDMTAEERRQKLLEAKQQQDALTAQQQANAQKREELEHEKIAAETLSKRADGEAKLIAAHAQMQMAEQDGFAKGHELAEKLLSGGEDDTARGSKVRSTGGKAIPFPSRATKRA